MKTKANISLALSLSHTLNVRKCFKMKVHMENTHTNIYTLKRETTYLHHTHTHIYTHT